MDGVMAMTQVPGVETIVGLVGQPPAEIPIDYNTVAKLQRLTPQWNTVFIALVPYCFKCKVPLVWHLQPYEEGHEDELYTCPSCGRVWVKDKEWEEHVGDKTKKDTPATG